MEQDILDQLYYGTIVPWENQHDKTPEMQLYNDQLYKYIEQLEKLLDDEGKRVLERLLDDSAELESLRVCEGFKDGFRLGVQLTAAGMCSGKERQNTQIQAEKIV